MTWNLFPFFVLPGDMNMALDAWLLRHTLEHGPCLRFYLWARPTLSLGRSQATEDIVDFDFCRANGIDVVRRPTGGRAVLHHMELTYAASGRFGQDGFPSPVQDTYRAVCEALCLGLQTMGVPAVLWEGRAGAALPTPKTPLPCFATPVPGEITAGGRKLVGSAMRADGPVFLQHGSILLDMDPALQRGVQLDKSDCPAATVSEWVRPLPSWGRILGVLEDAFSRRFASECMRPSVVGESEWKGIRAGARGNRVHRA